MQCNLSKDGLCKFDALLYCLLCDAIKRQGQKKFNFKSEKVSSVQTRGKCVLRRRFGFFPQDQFLFVIISFKMSFDTPLRLQESSPLTCSKNNDMHYQQQQKQDEFSQKTLRKRKICIELDMGRYSAPVNLLLRLWPFPDIRQLDKFKFFAISENVTILSMFLR